MAITHLFTSAIADGADATLVQPGDWNANHTISGSLAWDGATVTSSTPLLDLSQTWNNVATNFVGLNLSITNTTSSTGSKTFNFAAGNAKVYHLPISNPNQSSLYVEGSDTDRTNITLNNINGHKFTFYSTGTTNGSPNTFGVFDETANVVVLGLSPNTTGTGGVHIPNTGALGWSSDAFASVSAVDVRLFRDGAATLAQRSTTTAQTFRVYNTYTNSLNYERAVFDWTTSANILTIGAQAAGTGTNRTVQIVGNLIQIPNSSFTLGGAPCYFREAPFGGDCVIGGNTSAASGGQLCIDWNGNKITTKAAAVYGWSSTTDPTAAQDTGLARDAAGTIAQRNSTNAQTFRVYNTYTDASNYERGVIDWTTSLNQLTIGGQKAGTGSTRTVALVNAAAAQVNLNSNGNNYYDNGGGSHLFRNNGGAYSVIIAGQYTGSGDTVTASTPVLNLSQTWNAGLVTFTGIKLTITDTASAAASVYFDLIQGPSTSIFSVRKDGKVLMPFGASVGGGNILLDATGSIAVAASVTFSWTGQVALIPDAAGALAQRNGANAQTFRVYNTYTDSLNYERGVFDWTTTANTLTIGPQSAGTGTARNVNFLGTNVTFTGTGNMDFSAGAQVIFNGTLLGQGSSTLEMDTAGHVGGKFIIDSNSNVVLGGGTAAALATTATNGFLYITSCAGAPTGTPTSYTGRTPMVYDTTNNKLYVYNGAWKSVTLA